MPYTPIYPSAFDPAQRWAAVDTMLRELLGFAQQSAAYRPVASPYFVPARRWADVQAMVDVLTIPDAVPVYSWAFVEARRWAAFDTMLQAAYVLLLTPMFQRTTFFQTPFIGAV